ncbi:hypothetical protein [Planococcus salinus]|uniref:DUF3942 domain-containing protein n=1 Tax=Planococcus salinus TaxID=1848460 RepID=A0A3M8P7W8_9BACL|nr:hypothetical protein [Planococcus salinus]RNF39294.1 hypothetical protein EEX84_09400 [Planococcus salinus]
MLESLLTQKVKDRITSRKITDAEGVFTFFTDRFRDLTNDINAMDEEVVHVIKLEKEKVRFFELFEYKLELKIEEGFIAVLKGVADKRELIGKVSFKDGYSIATFEGEEEEYLLTYDAVDRFFDRVFKPLLD